MVLRSYPHGEDHNNTAGGDTSEIRRSHNRPIAFSAGPALGNSPASPPGEGKNFVSNGNTKMVAKSDSSMGQPFRGDGTLLVRARDDEIENLASEAGLPEPDEVPEGIDFLQLVREAENQAARYVAQINKRAWSQSMRAYNNEHFLGSKYTKTDWRHRSRIFRPKTRSAVRKDMAAVAASLFGNIDAISCLPGNEGDVRQRAAADLMQELVNYRTDRSSGKASIPWFLVAMGARQDANITGICVSKQSWKLELRKVEDNQQTYRTIDEQGEETEKMEETWAVEIDRPDSQLIPPENIIIDPAADWTNPLQSAAYVIIKWPMQVQEVLQKQESPVNPWEPVSYSMLLANTDSGTTDTSAIRRARELGIDRYDETQTGRKFQIVWVYETFMRVDGKDYTFLSCGDRAHLTRPKLVRDVYPEQFGERPLTMGYGHLDSHRLFPMSPVESWQQFQIELNDIANLTLDAVKQNVMPITKVRRGRQVDLDQVKKRSSGSSIMVQEPDDVTWENAPAVQMQQIAAVTRELDLEFDDLAGQFNGQTAENNNALSRTLGGLKLVSGSANAVQEFDIRVWIETWAQPTLAQIVRLIQYYEHDDVILGIAGDRAGLMKKYGVDTIDDDLLEQEVTIRVSVGLGAGDPQQRMLKFGQALQMAMPIIQASPEFARGEKEVDTEAVCQEIFGNAGYRDGGKRFFKQGQGGKGDPLLPLKAEEIKAKIEKDKKSGNAALLTALSNAAKVALGNRELDSQVAENIARLELDARDTGFRHGHDHSRLVLDAADKGHQHGMAVRQQGHHETNPDLMSGSLGSGQAGPGRPPPSGAASPPQPGQTGQPPGPPQGGPGAPPQPQGQPPGAPPGPQPPQHQTGSYMPELAAAQPSPPRNEAPTQQQQAVSGIRQESGQNRQSEREQSDRQALLQKLSQLAENLAKPRRVVRDKNGRVIGLA